ncbi:hypothetical protein [Gloeothece citriformis]|uniref:hypothetical protein n=1 Tax=Gloeothece citriformis TaxID=2546356 RepID=UPI00193D3420|nr:hypothetical protein [Gloeothece citriformis]
MPKKLKPCEKCQTLATIRYRIQHDDTQKWWLVCPLCWEQLSKDNPYYRYGGTWKAK